MALKQFRVYTVKFEDFSIKFEDFLKKEFYDTFSDSLLVTEI